MCKKYPRFSPEIGGISLNLFPKVAGGFAFLPYAATLCGTQRTENRRLEIAFRLLPLDKRKVVCFCNSALGLSVVTTCYRSYPDGSFKRKLISNSAVSRIIVA